MLYDSTHIAIRERGFAEILDLALHVTRAHASPLFALLAVGAGPCMLLNHLLLADLLEETLWQDPGGYVSTLLVLVALETPLATAPITLYLGQATFANRVSLRRLAREFVGSLPAMVLMQGVARMLTLLLLGIGLIVPYVLWPYLSELILLERAPLLGRKAEGGRKATVSAGTRSRRLHRGAGGDLFARWVVSLALGAMLIVVLVGGVHTLAEQFFGVQISLRTHLIATLPVVVWLVVGYFSVVRFLSYLDLRIRREGWEVQLTMNAEAARLAQLP